MTPEEIKSTGQSRLEQWHNLTSKVAALPVVLVSLKQIGKQAHLFTCIPDDMEMNEAITILENAVSAMKKQVEDAEAKQFTEQTK